MAQFGKRGVFEYSAAAQHDHPVGNLFDLGHEMGGKEHGRTLLRVAAAQFAEPPNPVDIEPVSRLVQNQRSRGAKKRRGDAKSLRHTERELAHPLARYGIQTGFVNDVVYAVPWYPVCRRHHEQVIERGPAWVSEPDVKERADLANRIRVVTERFASDEDAARGWSIEPENKAHCGCLASTVRPQKTGDRASSDTERHVIKGEPVAKPLAHLFELNHGRTLPLSPDAPG